MQANTKSVQRLAITSEYEHLKKVVNVTCNWKYQVGSSLIWCFVHIYTIIALTLQILML